MLGNTWVQVHSSVDVDLQFEILLNKIIKIHTDITKIYLSKY